MARAQIVAAMFLFVVLPPIEFSDSLCLVIRHHVKIVSFLCPLATRVSNARSAVSLFRWLGT